jgi:hypothetical protein
MTICRPAVLICVVLAICFNLAELAAADEPSCSVTTYVVPGDLITLTAPTAPQGVTYTYLWTITDPNGVNVLSDNQQSTKYTIPGPETSANYYVATLSVGSGTVTSGQITGCVLESCLLIRVQTSNTCSISGTQSVCHTNTETYTYTGNAAISGLHPTAYLNWYVDDTSVASNDATGQNTVNWDSFWDTSRSVAQDHTVKVEVRSLKSNSVLSNCIYDVTVLPSPVTTITPT